MVSDGTKLILIVEDSPDLQWLLNQLLTGEGYVTASAANGAEALLWLKEQERMPSAVLLDVMMPVMDGPTFYAYLRENASYRDIPVLFMTADSHPEVKLSAVEGRNFVRKPIDVERLLESLSAACGW